MRSLAESTWRVVLSKEGIPVNANVCSDGRPRHELVDCYEALEAVLAESTRLGYEEYRTHFGPAPGAPPSDYCWLAASMDPGAHEKAADFITKAMGELERRLVGDIVDGPGRILDVGCGAGGTIRSFLSRWPDAQFTGLNINRVQLNAARRILREHERVTLVDASATSENASSGIRVVKSISRVFVICTAAMRGWHV